MTKKVIVKTESFQYPILIDSTVTDLGDDAQILNDYLNEPVAIITNDTVAPLYLEKYRQKLASLGFTKIKVIITKDGEEYKSIETLNDIYTELLSSRFTRKSLLFALGGGVIGDIVGFAAATYLRGINFVQIPTTLLAQVDSSVGGKTAVNHPLGKNMIGAFYQPIAVIAELKSLDSLPDREYSAGIAEVIKYGCIYDNKFYQWLLEHKDQLIKRDKEVLSFVVERCCQIKAEIVSKDEKETTGTRALLNFGHTFGHAIEQVLGFGQWLHGEAVSCGMVLAMRLSKLLGYVQSDDEIQLKDFLSAFNLPVSLPEGISKEALVGAMQRDKKNQNNKIRFIILKSMGEASLTDQVDQKLLLQVLD